ncbi:MAG: type IV-A pilus assembly ATPase PilB, partial [Desulfobulbaceae bacterium]|nr:type IV-A pilus assembly ATPase PilB [Desulfobulbaceae bacterium]
MSASVKDQSGAGKLRIGEILRKEGQISSTQLDHALAVQKKNNGRLSSILRILGYIDQETIVNVLSRLHGYPAVTISREPPTPEALELMAYETAKKYLAFPLKVVGKSLRITMAEPTDTAEVEALQSDIKMGLSVCVSTEKEIIEAYQKHYGISDEEYKSFFPAEKEGGEEEEKVVHIDDFGALASEVAEDYELGISEEDERGRETYSATDAPIIKLVNGILIKAVNDGVSDIHIEPYEKS